MDLTLTVVDHTIPFLRHEARIAAIGLSAEWASSPRRPRPCYACFEKRTNRIVAHCICNMRASAATSRVAYGSYGWGRPRCAVIIGKQGHVAAWFIIHGGSRGLFQVQDRIDTTFSTNAGISGSSRASGPSS
jgi:hypothetical protein